MNDKRNAQKQGVDAIFGNDANDGDERKAASAVIDDLDQLRSRAEERDKFLELLQRTKADFDNYQKRILRDMESERKYALTPLVKDLLPAIDNLERALAAVKQDNDLSRGIQLVRSSLLDALKRHAITRIEGEGQPFDPHLHQAVMQRPEPGAPGGMVLQVLQPGYQLHDRVLRPASVVVSQGE